MVLVSRINTVLAVVSVAGVALVSYLSVHCLLSVAAAAACSLLFTTCLQQATAVWRVAWTLRKVPAAPGGDRPFGHVRQLLKSTAWELLCTWVMQNPPLVKVNVLQRKMLVVGSAEGMREVFQTKFRKFHKDLDFSFHPYLPILGSGLVTARGELWQKQRLLMAPVLRVDILKTVIRLTVQAVDRLSVKLEAAKASQQPIELEEEFRLLTLQIIGGAVLSLTHKECDRVGHSLKYLQASLVWCSMLQLCAMLYMFTHTAIMHVHAEISMT